MCGSTKYNLMVSAPAGKRTNCSSKYSFEGANRNEASTGLLRIPRMPMLIRLVFTLSQHWPTWRRTSPTNNCTTATTLIWPKGEEMGAVPRRQRYHAPSGQTALLVLWYLLSDPLGWSQKAKNRSSTVASKSQPKCPKEIGRFILLRRRGLS